MQFVGLVEGLARAGGGVVGFGNKLTVRNCVVIILVATGLIRLHHPVTLACTPPAHTAALAVPGFTPATANTRGAAGTVLGLPNFDILPGRLSVVGLCEAVPRA